MTLSFKVMSMYLCLEDCSFLLWFGVSACFFNIVSTTRSTREVQVTNFAMKLVLVTTYRRGVFADERELLL